MKVWEGLNVLSLIVNESQSVSLCSAVAPTAATLLLLLCVVTCHNQWIDLFFKVSV